MLANNKKLVSNKNVLTKETSQHIIEIYQQNKER